MKYKQKMIKILPQFKDAPLFREPTDAEISEIVDGVPVLSFRPEDLPRYRPSGRYNAFERLIRSRALAKKIIAFHPSYEELSLRKISTMASFNFAGVHIRTAVTKRGSQANLFVLKRPSLKEEEPNLTANILGTNHTLITPPIPTEVSRFVATHHQIGYMLQVINGLIHQKGFTGEYYSKLDAEVHGLNEFNKAAQPTAYREEMLHSLILRHALSSLTQEAPEYCLAPALSQIFAKHTNMIFPDLPDPQAAYNSYAEIRLRVAILADNQSAAETALQVGADKRKVRRRLATKNAFALELSSPYLQRAINLWDGGNVSRVFALQEERPSSNLYLATFIPQTKTVRHGVGYNHQLNNGDLFQFLGQIQQQGNIDDFTRANIEQILEAASIFCPAIAPTFGNIENTPELPCLSPKN